MMLRTLTPVQLAERMLSGDRRALARLLTRIEAAHLAHDPDSLDAILALVYPHTGRARVLGITGAPGTGKSTLVSALTQRYRQLGETVAILAVDPSSPFTGGAILGDRVRMGDLHGDAGVFIRSMAARGQLGGLASAARDCVHALDAAGFSLILIETVGAGQNEVAVAQLAQTVIVVEAPGLGDDVQAIKAGILEIADVLVVNKADKPGASATAGALRAMLDLGHPTRRAPGGHHGAAALAQAAEPEPEEAVWIAPIVQTTAVGTDSAEQGIDGLIAAIAAHQAFLHQHGLGRVAERAHAAEEVAAYIRADLWARFTQGLPSGTWDAMIEAAATRQMTPGQAARALLRLNG